MSRNLSKEYKEWSKEARKAMIDIGKGNREIAAECEFSRQYVTEITGGRREATDAILQISKKLNILPPKYLRPIKKAQ